MGGWGVVGFGVSEKRRTFDFQRVNAVEIAEPTKRENLVKRCVRVPHRRSFCHFLFPLDREAAGVKRHNRAEERPGVRAGGGKIDVNDAEEQYRASKGFYSLDGRHFPALVEDGPA